MAKKLNIRFVSKTIKTEKFLFEVIILNEVDKHVEIQFKI